MKTQKHPSTTSAAIMRAVVRDRYGPPVVGVGVQ